MIDTRAMRLIVPKGERRQEKCCGCGLSFSTVDSDWRITRTTLWQDRTTGRFICEGCVIADEDRRPEEES